MRLKHFYNRKFALVFAILLIVDTLHPVMALALTSGPSQPEVQGFKPIEATNMVDLFTGDFNYNLPLFEIDGYPVNMSYNSNARMEDEASWVGLGWTLNPGAINRDMRGMPDDFKDEAIEKQFNMKNDVTIGAAAGVGLEIFGLKAVKATKGIFWNNKKGYGTETNIGATLSLANKNSTHGVGLSASLNLNSQNGLNFGINLGLSKTSTETSAKVNVGTNINSRQGLKSINYGLSYQSKKDDINRSLSGSASMDLGGFTYFPTNPMPMGNTSFSFHGTLGGEAFGAHPHVLLDGYATTQYLRTKSQTQSGYGYLYNLEGQKSMNNFLGNILQRNTNVVLDCNRDNQITYREEMPNLPLSYGTYDNFTVAGQGVGGQFRLYKNDVGVLNNGNSLNTSTSISFGGELGAGNTFHGGSDFVATVVNNTSNRWLENNKVASVLPFTETNQNYEGQYFKDSGDKTIEDSAFINKIGGTNPAFVKLSTNFISPTADRRYEFEKNKQPAGGNAISTVLKKTQRGRRYGVMGYLTKQEAVKYGLDKTIKSYTPNLLYYNNTGNCPSPAVVTQLSKNHHIQEISIYKQDGSRYVFGLPAYNQFQKDVSFSVNENIAQLDTQAFVKYTPTATNPENSFKNNYGRDNFFESQQTPAYSYSHLLTGVLSDDYVDVTGNGITDDDLGNAVKFNYSQVYSNYKWRTPFAKDTARLMKGMKVDKLDDKGSYVYGEKEIWYMHSIESRNMVAQFIISNQRKDGYGVLGENGGLDASSALRKLDTIKIYSKSDLIKNGNAAIPIKQVVFEYDYSNCGQIPNGNDATFKGKLSLKKVYFTFGTNGKGKLNAYQFRYKYKNKTTLAPFNYDTVKVDRWGFYKPHPAGYPHNTDYPYSLQDTALANQYAGAWNMDTIYLPSGGRIVVDYESDDYAYVQNKRAGQMFFIKGFAKDTIASNFVAGSPNSKSLYTSASSLFASPTPNNYIVVDVASYSNLLNNTVSSNDEAVKRFFEDVKDIYFKARVQLTTDTTSYEYVTGYAGYDKTKVHYNGSTKFLYIPINNVVDGGSTVNPITLAAYQLMRFNLPDLAYSLTGQVSAVNEPKLESAKRAVFALTVFLKDASDIIKGFNKNRLNRQWGKTVDVSNKSWVRLANPNYKKMGGGSRVKRITVSDNWTVANGGGESNYVQDFTYTTALNGRMISSGVASYEPGLGSEEISLKTPMPYKDKVKLAPENTYYSENPIGENFFPSPTVGYSEVRVESTYPKVKRSGTGYSLNKFYTAKDFPVITDFTNISAGTVAIKPSVISKLFKFNVVEQRGVSQGFTIETNDMHGKMKEEGTYNQQGALVSATNYIYKVDDENGTPLHLNNDVAVVDSSGTIKTRKMGIETDIWQDMQDEQTTTQVRGVAANTDGFLAFIFPAVTVIPLPVFQNERRGLKTAITTKHIRRMGLIDKVIKTVDGSTIKTQNIAYDGETGDVLLTQTENEFNDPLFNFTYPAHWAYNGIGPAYKNIGSIFKGVSFDSLGIIQGVVNPNNFFVPGDELMLLKESNNTYEANLYHAIARTPGGPLAAFGPTGIPLDGRTLGTFTVKIKRSGRRNKASMPIGSIASLNNPIVGNSISITNATKVYQADAKEYKDDWQTACQKQLDIFGVDTVYSFVSNYSNPYISGLRGNWRGLRNFVQYNQRNIATVNGNNTNIRADGFIPTFTPYWTFDSDTKFWINNPNTNWVRSDSMHIYDARGNEIESSDANYIPSAAYYGFNGTQVVAVVSNSKHSEMTYDSFEDYQFRNDCAPTGTFINKNLKFFDSLKVSSVYKLVDTISHTGKYSLRLGGSSSFKIHGALGNEYCSPTGGNGTLSLLGGSGAGASAAAVGGVASVYTNCTDCLPEFLPQTGKTYTLTAWVATDSSISTNKKPLNVEVSVFFDGVSTSPILLKAQGPVIDGWQKVEGNFKIPATGKYVTFRFNNSNTNACFVDDVRVLPFNAKMKAYAYDWRSRRLMAELDENHYATFYEYDDEGILVRIKRETETGVQTVKEARNYLKPNNN